MSKIIVSHEPSTPPIPSVGTVVIYAKPDKVLYVMDETGLELPLTNVLEDSVLYFEGDFPPDFVNVDDYDFADGASFAPAVNEDIIFRVTPVRKYQEAGVQLLLRYCMSTASAGTLRFRFDYRVKEIGDPTSGGTNYQQELTYDPVDQAEELDLFVGLEIPATRITPTTELVYCRLTRVGTDVLDNHPGNFCLLGLGVFKL